VHSTRYCNQSTQHSTVPTMFASNQCWMLCAPGFELRPRPQRCHAATRRHVGGPTGAAAALCGANCTHDPRANASPLAAPPRAAHSAAPAF
jgi:hypothetical protein